MINLLSWLRMRSDSPRKQQETYETFDNAGDALKYLETAKFPIVLKADGLALGKGVLICNNLEEAKDGVKEIMEDKKFGDAGNHMVIEEFMTGREVSVLSFVDGKTIKLMSSAFIIEEDNKKYIKENIMYNHDTLPIGEFAIGTNTTAYMFARKFGIADKLEILIAEKTGPHFAVGDTCYSYEEDNDTFNFDGKKIIAKENEISAKRKTDPDKAYFSCHTDIETNTFRHYI